VRPLLGHDQGAVLIAPEGQRAILIWSLCNLDQAGAHQSCGGWCAFARDALRLHIAITTECCLGPNRSFSFPAYREKPYKTSLGSTLWRGGLTSM
jgi:hypothetical protein